MISIHDRQLEQLENKALADCIGDALDKHPEHKAALADPAGFRKFCFDLARAYRLDDEYRVLALVGLCLDLRD